jgi:hypothetical protein
MIYEWPTIRVLRMRILFGQLVRRAGVFRNGVHQGRSKVQQTTSGQDMGHRVSDTLSLVPCLSEISVHDLGKKALWPIRVDAVVRSVKFLHVAPHAAAIFLHRYLESRDSLARNLGHMLHIVEEGHGIVIGP